MSSLFEGNFVWLGDSTAVFLNFISHPFMLKSQFTKSRGEFWYYTLFSIVAAPLKSCTLCLFATKMYTGILFVRSRFSCEAVSTHFVVRLQGTLADTKKHFVPYDRCHISLGSLSFGVNVCLVLSASTVFSTIKFQTFPTNVSTYFGCLCASAKTVTVFSHRKVAPKHRGLELFEN